MIPDKIKVNMNVYDIPILVEALEEANKETERLHSIIKEAIEYIKYQLEHLDFEKDTKAKILGAMVLVMLDEEKK